jgi:hypothetical protein
MLVEKASLTLIPAKTRSRRGGIKKKKKIGGKKGLYIRFIPEVFRIPTETALGTFPVS